jgi:hypothetical protein
MKRDMDLIRKILIDVEAADADGPMVSFDDPHAAYQVALMKDAGLLEASISEDGFGRPSNAFVIRLTWDGHEFLDASRDSKIWKLAKDHIIKPGASWTFQVLMEWLKREAQQRFLGVPASS